MQAEVRMTMKLLGNSNWNSGDVVWDEQGGYFGLHPVAVTGSI